MMLRDFERQVAPYRSSRRMVSLEGRKHLLRAHPARVPHRAHDLVQILCRASSSAAFRFYYWSTTAAASCLRLSGLSHPRLRVLRPPAGQHA
jgi:hypothetical protein